MECSDSCSIHSISVLRYQEGISGSFHVVGQSPFNRAPYGFRLSGNDCLPCQCLLHGERQSRHFSAGNGACRAHNTSRSLDRDRPIYLRDSPARPRACIELLPPPTSPMCLSPVTSSTPYRSANVAISASVTVGFGNQPTISTSPGCSRSHCSLSAFR